MQISIATAADHEAIRLILHGAALPTQDLARPLIASFVVARWDDAAVVATGAVERAGIHGLLRSVAVLPGFRGKGIGKQIVNALEVRARSDRVAALYILTTSAQSFFSNLGYETL